MEKAEKIVQTLNEMIDNDEFNLIEFDFLLKRFMEETKTSVKFLDLEFYDEARMLSARNNKIANERIKDFNSAFEYREIERKCLKYSQLKSDFKIEKSTFYLYREYLLYFCLGNGKNHKVLRDFLDDLNRLKKV
jgi:hypothetical protein